jgi:hypothetical protein
LNNGEIIMSNSSSGRNEFNAGSDTAKHYGSTPSAEYAKAGDISKATGNMGKQNGGYVGSGNGFKPTDPRSIVKT